MVNSNLLSNVASAFDGVYFLHSWYRAGMAHYELLTGCFIPAAAACLYSLLLQRLGICLALLPSIFLHAWLPCAASVHAWTLACLHGSAGTRILCAIRRLRCRMHACSSASLLVRRGDGAARAAWRWRRGTPACATACCLPAYLLQLLRHRRMRAAHAFSAFWLPVCGRHGFRDK